MSNPDHQNTVDKYIDSTKNKERLEYMLTIARDGEVPVRSIYHLGDAISAAEAYNRYNDFGFAKEFLSVVLYQPDGQISSKVLKRPPAGECSYVKENYYAASKLIRSFRDILNESDYSRLVEGFALIFSQDNIRFNSDRFFSDLEYTKDKD